MNFQNSRRLLRAVGQAVDIPRRGGGDYKGTVANVRDFGCSVNGCSVKTDEICEGLVGRDELFQRGQEPDKEFEPVDGMIGRVTGIDDRGRLALSRGAALEIGESEDES